MPYSPQHTTISLRSSTKEKFAQGKPDDEPWDSFVDRVAERVLDGGERQ